MKKVIILLILGFLIFLLASCCHAVWWWDGSTADIASFKDPSFSDYKISKIMIYSANNDLRERNKIEERFVKKFASTKFTIEPISSLKYISPLKKYTDEELEKILNDSKAESVMIITITDTRDKKSYVPESYDTTISGYINGDYLDATQETTKSGGYYVHATDIKFELRILDVATGNTIWLANSLSFGTCYSSFKNMIDVVANKTFKQLQKDGLLKKNNIQQP
jgi:hypothetical protein